MMIKHGVGEVLPEDKDEKKTASKNWTQEDAAALVKENEDADK